MYVLHRGLASGWGLATPLLVVLMRTSTPGFLHHVSNFEAMVDLRLLADVLDGVANFGELISTIVG